MAAYWKSSAIRVEFFGDEIDRLSEIDPVTGAVTRRLTAIPVWPASHYVTSKEKMDRAIVEIGKELDEREAWFVEHGKLVEAQRIRQRTTYDMEMMRELGYCSGIENYSRVISNRPVGSPPMTLMDYFPDDFILFVDESHVTLPQVRAMYNGDRARKESLVEYGFRLPCAFDNRPLKFDEFQERFHQAVYVSATPRRVRAGARQTRSWSRSSGPRAFWTPGWRCGPSRARSTTSLGRSTPGRRGTSGCW